MQQRRKVRSFEDLLVWQMGIELVKRIYRVTTEGDFSRDFGLKDQILRASVSVPTNIAEGFELSSRKEYLKFLNIAKGSAGEVRSLLRVAWEIGYIESTQRGAQRCNYETQRISLQPHEEHLGRSQVILRGR